VIESLYGIALAGAVPLGFLIAARLLVDGSGLPRVVAPVAVAAIALAIVALVVGRGPLPALLVTPWLLVTLGLAAWSSWSVLHDLLARRLLAEPWRIGVAAATGFLAVGATWLLLDRASIQPFGFDPTIVLLTAVHFHVAGFGLTLAGSLAARSRPGIALHLVVVSLVVGTPLTALGFFGLPLVSWVGAVLVAGAGIGIGVATVALSRGVVDRVTRSALLVGGATLFMTMPLAVGYATGVAFAIPFLGIPAMAAIHGGLNVVGFATPAMVGWHRVLRTGASGHVASGPVRPGDTIGAARDGT
jgi:hypothetical protein